MDYSVNIDHMDKSKIQITTEGVKDILQRFKPSSAVAEYIWNGFDAGANNVDIQYESKDMGYIETFKVIDDGIGINFNKLEKLFGNFYKSEKQDIKHNGKYKNHSIPKGHIGVGRLTFFAFATKATWVTSYLDGNETKEFTISIEEESIDTYQRENSLPIITEEKTTKTEVIFKLKPIFSEATLLSEILPFLKKEFCWFLELYPEKKITINGTPLSYKDLIRDKDEMTVKYPDSNTEFKVKYIAWHEKLNDEYSTFYYINEANKEIWKETTTLNNQGDLFYHSVYVTSGLFKEFDFSSNSQKPLIGKNRQSDEFIYLLQKVTEYLRDKRQPFLVEDSEKFISSYEKESILPIFSDDNWEQIRKKELKDVLKGIYQIEPKLLNFKSEIHSKTFVRFLNELLDSAKRDKLIVILNEVINLSDNQIDKLLQTLKSAKLSSIIDTIELITERVKVKDIIQQLVMNKDLKANEIDHLQAVLEKNYWIFGEQYNLVASAEVKFEKALKNYLHILWGIDKDIKIDHKDKNREVDILLTKQIKETNRIENILVELKSPSVSLGDKELGQVKKYMDVILKQDEFNGNNYFWTFYLIGNKFDTSGYIEREIDNAKGNARRSLAFKTGNYEIYVKTWSEVFAEFEIRHNFLSEKLNLEREQICTEIKSPEEGVEIANNSIVANR